MIVVPRGRDPLPTTRSAVKWSRLSPGRRLYVYRALNVTAFVNGYVSPLPSTRCRNVAALRASTQPVWIFAYGSLMWTRRAVCRTASGVVARLSPQASASIRVIIAARRSGQASVLASIAAAPAEASPIGCRRRPQCCDRPGLGAGDGRQVTICARCTSQPRRQDRGLRLYRAPRQPGYAGGLSSVKPRGSSPPLVGGRGTGANISRNTVRHLEELGSPRGHYTDRNGSGAYRRRRS